MPLALLLQCRQSGDPGNPSRRVGSMAHVHEPCRRHMKAGLKSSRSATALVEALCDALRHHGLGGSPINRLDLVSERGPQPGKTGAIGPLRGFP